MYVERMLAEILKTHPLDHLGITITLTHLSFTVEKFEFAGTVVSEHQLSPPGFSIVLNSGTSAWPFRSVFKEDCMIFEGGVPTKDLSRDASLTILFNNIQCLWMEMRLDLMPDDDADQWSSYFSGYKSLLPDLNLGRLAKQILGSAEVIYAVKPSGRFDAFCEYVKSPDFVVGMARLRKHGRFPAIIKE